MQLEGEFGVIWNDKGSITYGDLTLPKWKCEETQLVQQASKCLWRKQTIWSNTCIQLLWGWALLETQPQCQHHTQVLLVCILSQNPKHPAWGVYPCLQFKHHLIFSQNKAANIDNNNNNISLKIRCHGSFWCRHILFITEEILGLFN